MRMLFNACTPVEFTTAEKENLIDLWDNCDNTVKAKFSTMESTELQQMINILSLMP